MTAHTAQFGQEWLEVRRHLSREHLCKKQSQECMAVCGSQGSGWTDRQRTNREKVSARGASSATKRHKHRRHVMTTRRTVGFFRPTSSPFSASSALSVSAPLSRSTTLSNTELQMGVNLFCPIRSGLVAESAYLCNVTQRTNACKSCGVEHDAANELVGQSDVMSLSAHIHQAAR